MRSSRDEGVSLLSSSEYGQESFAILYACVPTDNVTA